MPLQKHRKLKREVRCERCGEIYPLYMMERDYLGGWICKECLLIEHPEYLSEDF